LAVRCGIPTSEDVTGLLAAWRGGDEAALAQLLPIVYAELHRLAEGYMRGEKRDATIQATALVHEAYMRLVDVRRMPWQNRAHFFAMAATLMRRVLVDAARTRLAKKRGDGAVQVALEETVAVEAAPALDVLAVDRALDQLSAFDARKARVVELRFFAGLTVEETAEALHISEDTVVRDWKMAKSWLARELRG
jgi:RNA polymerase sigma factor (TIGR02999 family)